MNNRQTNSPLFFELKSYQIYRAGTKLYWNKTFSGRIGVMVLVFIILAKFINFYYP